MPAKTKEAETEAVEEKRSIVKTMADRYGLDVKSFMQLLSKTILPKNITQEQAASFLLVCERYDLDPFASEVYAFAANGTVKALIGVDGYVSIAQRNPAFDGISYEEVSDKDGNVIGITCKVKRRDRSDPTVITEWLEECRGNSPMWKKMPRRMLRHKATIQCIRLALGLSGLGDLDEYRENIDLVPAKSSDVVDLNKVINKGEESA